MRKLFSSTVSGLKREEKYYYLPSPKEILSIFVKSTFHFEINSLEHSGYLFSLSVKNPKMSYYRPILVHHKGRFNIFSRN